MEVVYFSIYFFLFVLFLTYKREYGIHEDKKVELQNLLVKMSHDEESTLRRTAVRLLGEMEVHRKDAYLTVVRRLVDDDRKTREEAKKALNTLTGTALKGAFIGIDLNSCHKTILFDFHESKQSANIFFERAFRDIPECDCVEKQFKRNTPDNRDINITTKPLLFCSSDIELIRRQGNIE